VNLAGLASDPSCTLETSLSALENSRLLCRLERRIAEGDNPVCGSRLNSRL